MRRLLALGAATVVFLGLLADPGVACASGHVQASLGVFPAEAISRPLYWGVENGGHVTFTVRIFDASCDGSTSQVNYAGQDGSATSGLDYTLPPGFVTVVNAPGHPNQVQVNAQVTNDALPDVGAVEQATITLTGASGATIIQPSSAPLFIVDDDGLTPRVAFGGGEYEEIEGSGQGGIPVFRGGSGDGTAEVTYTISSGSAQAGSDFSASSGTLSFGPNERAKLIPITVLDDLDAEGSESFTVTLSGPGVVEEPSTATFFIRDNEERIKPTSSLHHPNNRKKYRSNDFRIREVHVFTKDNPGGAGVVQAQFALRKNLKGGKCQWWVKGRKFRKGDCDKQRWKGMGKFEPNFFFIRIDSLPPSKGKIGDYTAFSRAIDGAGNVETFLNTGENHNTFEIKPGKS